MFKNLPDYKRLLTGLMKFLVRFKYTVVALVVVGIFSFSILRINGYSAVERDDDVYATKLLEVKGVEFNQETLERIFELRDLDIDVQSIFPDDRTNPFN